MDETLERIGKRLEELEAQGLQDSDEYDDLSDDYQAIAQDLVLNQIFGEDDE